jgi:hypothetical protein
MVRQARRSEQLIENQKVLIDVTVPSPNALERKTLQKIRPTNKHIWIVWGAARVRLEGGLTRPYCFVSIGNRST